MAAKIEQQFGLRRKKTASDAGELGGVVVRHTWVLMGGADAVQWVAHEIEPGSSLWDDYDAFERTHKSMLFFRHPATQSLWAPMDMGHHAPHDNGGWASENCNVLGGQCYYSGSSLLAIEVCSRWAEQAFDDEAIWGALAAHYLGVTDTPCPSEDDDAQH